MIEASDVLVEVIYLRTGTTEKPTGKQAGMPASSTRVTHLPTGTMAQVGRDVARSQHKQEQIALDMIEWALASH